MTIFQFNILASIYRNSLLDKLFSLQQYLALKCTEHLYLQANHIWQVWTYERKFKWEEKKRTCIELWLTCKEEYSLQDIRAKHFSFPQIWNIEKGFKVYQSIVESNQEQSISRTYSFWRKLDFLRICTQSLDILRLHILQIWLEQHQHIKKIT